MKNLIKMLVLACCLGLVVVACGEDEDDENGENGDTVTGAFCDDTCEADEDCDAIDDGTCNDDSFCEYPAAENGDEEADTCDSDSQCVAAMSGWIDATTQELKTCADDSECDDAMNEVCAEYEGDGYCVMEAADPENCPIGEATELDLTDSDETVEVCANADTTCHEDGHCTMCSDDSDCEDSADFGAGTCLDNGTCGCGDDAECADNTDNADTCFDGTCGCSDDEVCGEDQACRDF